MQILKEIRACTLCADVLPRSPKPILQFSKTSSLLIVGQAPGVVAHETGIPWNDASGERLRNWLNVSRESFYDASKVAIVPVGFCYPGRGKSGDLPPRPECRVRWMDSILCHLTEIQFTVVIGAYAASYFCGKGNLSEYIKEFSLNASPMVVLPHPSPRNNIWLSKNEWFEQESLPAIKSKLCRKVSFI